MELERSAFENRCRWKEVIRYQMQQGRSKPEYRCSRDEKYQRKDVAGKYSSIARKDEAGK
jgi:hypothetical protein